MNNNWAEDVEAVGQKSEDSQVPAQEQAKAASSKDEVAERTKSDSRISNGASGSASPELAPSNVTDKTDDSSAANGGTDATSAASTWETKSQASEGTWIADREKRQQSNGADTSAKAGSNKNGKSQGKDSKEAAPSQPAPPPPVLHEAPAPAVNPWTKRAEDAKAKTSAKPIFTDASNDQQRSDAPAAPKINGDHSRDAHPQADAKRSADTKRPSDPRITARQGSRNGSDHQRADAHAARPAQREHNSLPNLTAVAPPPPAKDEVSWPTPETAQKEIRKESVVVEKDTKEGEGADAEGASSGKPRDKTKWKTIPVNPTIKWETEEMNRPPGSRPGRGGSGTRSRGGLRGQGGYRGSDRAAGRHQASHGETDETSTADATARGEGNDRDAMPPPPRPAQMSSRSQSLDRRAPRHRPSPPKGGFDRSAVAVPMTMDARRTASPSKAEHAGPNGTADAKASESNIRANGAVEESGEPTTNGEPHSRKTHGDSRRESRSFDTYNNKEWSNGSTRGNKRGGRGRGGSREFTNGHQAGQAFTNGNADLAGAYPVPPSPSTFQSPRGGFGPQQGRGGWRGNPRSQSIPIESPFGRFQQYPHPGQIPPPVQTGYYPPVYDPTYNAMPMTAMPYAPVMDHSYLVNFVTTQLEYYFSLDNLIKDTYLRRQMDSQGFVFFDVVVNFNRVKNLSQDRDLIKAAALKSEDIEIRVGEDGKERLRKREGWEPFVLPMDQREPASQNDGPKVLRRPEAPQLQPIWSMNPGMGYRGPASAGPHGPQQRRPFDMPGYGVNGMVTPFSPFSPTSQDAGPFGEDQEEMMRGRSAKSPLREYGDYPSQPLAGARAAEPDTFPDQRISELNVIYKQNPNPSRAPYHSTSSRTFSNGSIDTHNIASEIEKLSERNDQASTSTEAVANGEETEPNGSASSGNDAADKDSSEVIFLWLKDQEFHQDDIPKGTHVQPYFSLRSEAFSQRDRAPHGSCPHDLDILYKFWSHFLIRNFNNRMYGEFKFYAIDDAKQRDTIVGLTHLVNFYVNALKSNTHIIRDAVVIDFLELVQDQPQNFQNYGFKQLRQAWRDGATNLKNRKKLTQFVEEPLRAQLES